MAFPKTLAASGPLGIALPRFRDYLTCATSGIAACARSHCCYHNGVFSPANIPPAFFLKTVFLDRDGVVNQKMPEGQWVTRWTDFQVLPGVIEAIAALKRAALQVIVVSNQRGIALGRFSEDDVRAIHARFQQMLEAFGAQVDGFYFCPHDRGQCNCRKPLPGLFDQAVAGHPEIHAHTSVIIGDSKSDMEFGRRLGMRTVFIDADPARQKPGAEAARALADLHASSLPDAVESLLKMRMPDTKPSSMCLGFPGK
jgi:D-glycero-D-manno-heptose 1,7-bisphosphate phosphatase